MTHKALWRIKPIAEKYTNSNIKRVFGPWQLIALGVGVTVGAGLFSLTGIAAGQYAGPAVTISFLIAAIACTFSALCYAELASMIPSGGSSYSYAYASLGEFVAWIIGCVLIMEYTAGAATMAASWSGYVASLLQNWGLFIDPRILYPPNTSITLIDGTETHAWFNAPAIFVILIISAFLIRGTEISRTINNFIVALKLLVIIAVICACIPFVQSHHYTPFIPANMGEFGYYGISGIFRAAGMAFFAYLGFDIICTVSQETHNPQRNIPIAILGTQLICGLLYVIFAAILVGVVDYKTMSHDVSPIATAMDITHIHGLALFVKLGICLGYLSVIYGMLMAQNRITIAMTEDGLLPSILQTQHPKHKTAWYSYILTALMSAFLGAILPASYLGNITSMSTVFAFIIVCMGVMILRIKMPNAPRNFRLPFGAYFIPILGIISCAVVIFSIDATTWKTLIIFLLIATLFYFLYGIRHSRLNS